MKTISASLIICYVVGAIELKHDYYGNLLPVEANKYSSNADSMGIDHAVKEHFPRVLILILFIILFFYCENVFIRKVEV